MPLHPSQEFPFDIYGDLSGALDTAFTRNMEQSASPEAVARTGLTKVVRDALQQQREASVQQWLSEELGGNGALSKWQRYDTLMPVPTPDLDMLKNPKLAETYNRLYKAKQALDASPETAHSGEQIGETMHLVVVPWQAFKENRKQLPQWIKQMRRRQGMNEADYFNSDLLEAITSDTPVYRAWDNTSVVYTAREYLNYRINQDGPWGIMLAQISRYAGLKNFLGKSPDELTDHGRKHFEVAEQKVDGLGFFEWLALILQEQPSGLSLRDRSWLLAHRLTAQGLMKVPYGNWNGVRVGSGLDWAGSRDGYTRPRLAVRLYNIFIHF